VLLQVPAWPRRTVSESSQLPCTGDQYSLSVCLWHEHVSNQDIELGIAMQARTHLDGKSAITTADTELSNDRALTGLMAA
jgi:hypothetical protein